MSEHVLLLPGMMCDQRLWRQQISALAQSGKRSVAVGDLTGADSITALAEHVLASAPPSFALAGLSMGGIVAFEIWRQAPRRIERLAILDSNYLPDTPDRRRLRDEQMVRAGRGELELLLRDELKPNYLALAHRDNVSLLDEVLAMGLELGPAVFRAQSLALRNRPDSSATLATINCPSLVLCGDEDSLCPPQRHAEMAEQMPAAELVVVPQCGHLSTMEQPAAVNRALSDWLRR